MHVINQLFVLTVLNDSNGIGLVVHADMNKLFKMARDGIRTYLAEDGRWVGNNVERCTEEGYATVYYAPLNGEDPVEIWSYPFDGQESLDDAIKRGFECRSKYSSLPVMKKKVHKMWLIFDVLFFDMEKAVALEDGKDVAKEVFVGINDDGFDLDPNGIIAEFFGTWIYSKEDEAIAAIDEYNQEYLVEEATALEHGSRAAAECKSPFWIHDGNRFLKVSLNGSHETEYAALKESYQLFPLSSQLISLAMDRPSNYFTILEVEALIDALKRKVDFVKGSGGPAVTIDEERACDIATSLTEISTTIIVDIARHAGAMIANREIVVGDSILFARRVEELAREYEFSRLKQATDYLSDIDAFTEKRMLELYARVRPF